MFSLLQDIPMIPAEGAFRSGQLEMPTDTTGLATGLMGKQWDEHALLCILGLVTIVVAIIMLQRIVDIIPSLIGCAWRSKECFNLEDSAQLSRDRDLIAYVMIIPFCLFFSTLKVWTPGKVGAMTPTLQFLVFLGAFLLYIGIRVCINIFFHPRGITSKAFKAGNKTFRTFFLINTLLGMATAGIMMLFHSSFDQIKDVILWETAFFYFIFIIRKTQIFLSGSSIFSTFLYLCALEFLPTALLVVPAILF